MKFLTEYQFLQKSASEQIDYLLTHPIPHILKASEVHELLDLRESGRDYIATKFNVFPAETIISTCFDKVLKIPYTKWQKLFDLPDWILAHQDEIPNKKQPSRRNTK